LDYPGKRTRDPNFRFKILRAYEYSCAVCGFNVRLGNHLVGVEAAHIKWHQAGGPDTEEHGIALCAMHHKLFDRGVFTLNEDRVLLVAEEANGSKGFDEWLMRFHEKQIKLVFTMLRVIFMNYILFRSGPYFYLFNKAAEILLDIKFQRLFLSQGFFVPASFFM